jgi:hypothetical protein
MERSENGRTSGNPGNVATGGFYPNGSTVELFPLFKSVNEKLTQSQQYFWQVVYKHGKFSCQNFLSSNDLFAISISCKHNLF